MKIRTIKLREAHKNGDGGEPCLSSILWDAAGEHIVTASSGGNSICIHDAVSLSNPPKTLRNHREGVTALALSPDSTCLASGSIDHSVKLYKFPGGDFENNITRFTLPIRSVAFNKSGSILAAAGDDEGIKLVNTIDGTIARVLKGHKGSVTSLAFDPNNDYLASVDSIGTVIYWELLSGSTLHVLNAIAPYHGSNFSVLNILAWSPDGEMLAVPGLKNDVVMYDRYTAEKLFSLRGDHVEPICFMSWSPNGKYMATSDLDGQVLIWDVDKKLDIERQKFSEPISCVSWKPNGNALAVIDVTGKYGIWEPAVPLTMKSPTEGIPSSSSKTSNGLLLFDGDEEPNGSDDASDSNDDTIGELEFPRRKRSHENPYLNDDWEGDTTDKLGIDTQDGYHKRAKYKHTGKRNTVSKSMVSSVSPKMQESFQPGSTPAHPGKRHFLCYNMTGSVTSMEYEGYSHIEIEFHDTSSCARIPAMTDYFGITMASLNDNGCAFANPSRDGKQTSMLTYRPFKSWANNSEWSMRFEGEDVRAVAVGTGWVAALTSLNFLRIFTEGGLQKHILSLDGPVVTAAGYKDQLAIVTHISSTLPTNEQMLELRVLNIPQGMESLKARVPLTPGSCLSWFGFSEEGQLSSFDSKGVLRIFTSQFGGCWLPLFSASKLQKPNESYWIVGLNTSKLFCIVCKSPESFPQTTPKPVLTLLDLSFPVASSDLGADSLENEFMLNNMHLSHLQRTIEERAASGLDTSSLDDDAFDIETSLDRCILRLIASCCNGDKLFRATELVKLLSLEKSLRGAIKLATSLKQPNLAERFNDILEERLLGSKIGNSTQGMKSNSSVSTQPEKSVFPKPCSPQEASNPPKHTASSSLIVASATNKGEKNQTPASKNTAIKASNVDDHKNGEHKKMTRLDQVNPTRPCNPFAKQSSNQETSSLFDSLKKAR